MSPERLRSPVGGTVRSCSLWYSSQPLSPPSSLPGKISVPVRYVADSKAVTVPEKHSRSTEIRSTDCCYCLPLHSQSLNWCRGHNKISFSRPPPAIRIPRTIYTQQSPQGCYEVYKQSTQGCVEPTNKSSLYKLELYHYSLAALNASPWLGSSSVIGQGSKCYHYRALSPPLPPLLAPLLRRLQANLWSSAAGGSSGLLWLELPEVREALVRQSCIFARQTSDFALPCPVSVPAVRDRLLPCEPSQKKHTQKIIMRRGGRCTGLVHLSPFFRRKANWRGQMDQQTCGQAGADTYTPERRNK